MPTSFRALTGSETALNIREEEHARRWPGWQTSKNSLSSCGSLSVLSHLFTCWVRQGAGGGWGPAAPPEPSRGLPDLRGYKQHELSAL